MIVVDSSAVLDALVGRPPNRALLARLATDDDLHAPAVLDLEVLGGVDRLLAGGLVSADRADDVRADFAELAVLRYTEGALLDRIWELRTALSPAEASFVALAELLAAPLVTTDPRFAAASGHAAEIELYSAA